MSSVSLFEKELLGQIYQTCPFCKQAIIEASCSCGFAKQALLLDPATVGVINSAQNGLWLDPKTNAVEEQEVEDKASVRRENRQRVERSYRDTLDGSSVMTQSTTPDDPSTDIPQSRHPTAQLAETLQKVATLLTKKGMHQYAEEIETIRGQLC